MVAEYRVRLYTMRHSMDSLQQIAHKRLFPPLTQPSYLVLRSRRKIMKAWLDEFAQKPLRVLDVGGRYQPYRPLVEQRIEKYVAIDVLRTELVSVLADGQALPFAPESFDLVIATQVFEYFESPELAVRQIHSVLRSGGVLVASVAAFAPRFDEREKWRFLPAGIQHLLRIFHSVEIVPEVHNLGGLIRSANVGLSVIFRSKGIRSIYRWTICPTLNVVGLALETFNIDSNDLLATNYSIRAVK